MRKIFYIIFSFFFLSADYSRLYVLQDPSASNTKIKANHLYNFTKYIDWPDKYKEGNFVIAILGASPFYNDLYTLLSEKKIGNRSFEVKNFASVDAITGAVHILFIPTEYSDKLADVLKKLRGKSTLIVTEKPGLAKQGACINFVVDNNKQRFELNRSNIEKYNMKVSSSLEAFAIKIE